MTRSILKNISLLTAQDVIFHLLGIGFYVVLAREQAETGIGKYSYAIALASIFTLFFDFGAASHYWREWTKSLATLNSDRNAIFSQKVILLPVVSVGIILFALLFERQNINLVFFAYIYAILETMRSLPLSYFMAKNNFLHVVIFNTIDKGVGFLGSILLLLTGFSIELSLVFFLLCKLISFVFLFLTSPVYKISLKTIQIQHSSRFLLTIPTFLITVLSLMYFKVDTIIIRFILGFQQLGLYNAAYRFTDVVYVISAIIGFSTFPHVQNLAKKSILLEQAFIQKVVQVLIIIGSFIGIFMSFYSTEILQFLYGVRFSESTIILQILSINIAILFPTTYLASYLYFKKQEKFILKRLFILIFINIFSNIILIPRIGIKGAAITTLVCEILSLVLLSLKSNMNFKLKWVLELCVGITGLIITLYFAHPPLLVMGILCTIIYCMYVLFSNQIPEFTTYVFEKINKAKLSLGSLLIK